MADNPGVKGVLIHKLEVERFDKESLALKVSLVVKVGMSAIHVITSATCTKLKISLVYFIIW